MLIASANRLFAESAAAYIDRRKGWRCAGIAFDGVRALEMVRRLKPSVVLTIEDLHRLDPATLAGQVRRRWPDIAVVLLGGAEDAEGFVLPPGTTGADVAKALASPQAHERPRSEPGLDIELLRTLTARERRILKLLAEGLPIRDIADRLGVSVHTVRTHMQNLYSKLGLHSRLDAFRFALHQGLVSAAPEE